MHEYRLIRDLMKGYQKQVKPSRNHSDALNVTFGLALSQIIDVVSLNPIYYKVPVAILDNVRSRELI